MDEPPWRFCNNLITMSWLHDGASFHTSGTSIPVYLRQDYFKEAVTNEIARLQTSVFLIFIFEFLRTEYMQIVQEHLPRNYSINQKYWRQLTSKNIWKYMKLWFQLYLNAGGGDFKHLLLTEFFYYSNFWKVVNVFHQ